MKATIKVEKEFEIKQVLIKAGVRHWEEDLQENNELDVLV